MIRSHTNYSMVGGIQHRDASKESKCNSTLLGYLKYITMHKQKWDVQCC